jgi:hypothetical protein
MFDVPMLKDGEKIDAENLLKILEQWSVDLKKSINTQHFSKGSESADTVLFSNDNITISINENGLDVRPTGSTTAYFRAYVFDASGSKALGVKLVDSNGVEIIYNNSGSKKISVNTNL